MSDGLAVRLAEIADAALQPVDEGRRLRIVAGATQLESESLAQPTRLAGDRAGIVLRIRRDQVGRLLAVVEIQAIAPSTLGLLRHRRAHSECPAMSRAARCAFVTRRGQRGARLLAAILHRLGAGIAAILALHGNLERAHHRVDVELDGAGHENLVPAAVHRVARLHDDAPASAGMTGDGETARDAAADQEAVVQALPGDDVVRQRLQVVVGQQLAGKEGGPARGRRDCTRSWCPASRTRSRRRRNRRSRSRHRWTRPGPSRAPAHGARCAPTSSGRGAVMPLAPPQPQSLDP